MRKQYIFNYNRKIKYFYTYDDKFYYYDFHYIHTKYRRVGRLKRAYSPIFPKSLKCIDFYYMNSIRYNYKIRNKKFVYVNYIPYFTNTIPSKEKFFRLD